MGTGVEVGSERRDYVRLSKELNVNFQLEGENTETIHKAISKDISHGGIRLEILEEKKEILDMLKSKEYKLNVNVILPKVEDLVDFENDPGWIRSEIRWVKPPKTESELLQVGVEFIQLSAAAHRYIHGYIVHEFVSDYGKV